MKDWQTDSRYALRRIREFVGRLDVVIRDGEVMSHDYELFPVDATVPEDPEIVDIVEEYSEALNESYNTSQVIGYANETLTRYGTVGGDSMLGNFAAEAMRFYPGVETEIALTNTLGIRSDIPAGDITLDALYNSMPFDNTITTMFLSGREVQELLDYVASRSTERGCNSQAQVAGIRFNMICTADDGWAEDVLINGEPLEPEGTYNWPPTIHRPRWFWIRSIGEKYHSGGYRHLDPRRRHDSHHSKSHLAHPRGKHLRGRWAYQPCVLKCDFSSRCPSLSPPARSLPPRSG